MRDTHGNIVVDPAGNILKDQYLLDFNIYKNLHFINDSKASAGENSRPFIKNLSKKQLDEIKELFAANKRESIFGSGQRYVDSRI